LVLPISIPVAADAYTDAIKGEAKKIDARPVVPAAEPTQTPSAARDATPAAFEKELQQASPGTWLVYQKLPEERKKEIFDAYKDGAPIEQVRTMVTDRFQNRR
jgi:hypothetical protein